MPSETRNLSLCVSRPSFLTANANASADPYDALLVESQVPKTEKEKESYVLIRVDRFGFSANNITYQALGEAPHFRYFDFHAVPESEKTSQRSHGLIPVWGFGTIVWSSHKRIEVGERVYGYFAPTRYLLLPISPADVNKYAFFVSRPHFPRDRRPYNQVTRCSTDPLYNPSPEVEDLTMLYRPLFWTSYWFEDWLAASSFRGGVSRFIISSASAKTAFCLAYLIRERFRKLGKLTALDVVGLTSKKNVGFTRSLGLYNSVVEYDELSAFFATVASGGKHDKWIYVDVAGNEALNEKLRALFVATNDVVLAAHISLGFTNLSSSAPAASSASASASSWSENTKLLDVTPSRIRTNSDSDRSPSESASPFGLPTPESFFMPEWLAVRRTQLSVAEITTAQAGAWAALLRDGPSWVRIEHVYGGERVKDAYEQVARNGIAPEKGFIWSMWDEGGQERAAKAKL